MIRLLERKNFLLILCMITFSLFITGNARAISAEDAEAIQYGSKYYDKLRAVTYWGKLYLSVQDYLYSSGDTEVLKLAVKGKDKFDTTPIPELSSHFRKEFERLFGDLLFHDLDEGHDQRWNKAYNEEGKPNDISSFFDRFAAAEEARRHALYGGRAGAIYCHIRVKRRVFPILYEITCSLSSEDDLRYASWNEEKDLGYSSPEYIVGSLKTTLTSMMESMSEKVKKVRKYKSNP